MSIHSYQPHEWDFLLGLAETEFSPTPPFPGQEFKSRAISTVKVPCKLEYPAHQVLPSMLKGYRSMVS